MLEEVKKYLDMVKKLKVLVIGEAVLDEYIFGEVIGKTNKSASLVLRPENIERFAGVPFNVANNISEFCEEVSVFAMSGRDGNRELFLQKLNSNVSCRFFYWDYSTIIKRRYVSYYNNSKVFEVYDFVPSFFDDHELIEALEKELEKYDLVLVCDSGHGMLTYNVRELLREKARFLAVNTQMNAGNIGEHSLKKYLDRTDKVYFCVNEREFILAYHEIWDKYNSLDKVLLSTTKCISAVTLGPKGCVVCDNSRVVHSNALSDSVTDTVGAGDAFFSLSSLMSFCGSPIEQIGFVGNVAGAIKSQYQGNNKIITKEDLYLFIERKGFV